MRSLFVVHTPYHLIMSVGLCKQYKTLKSDILIYKDFNIDTIDIQVLKSEFHNVYLYNKNKYILSKPKINIPRIQTIYRNKSKTKCIKSLIKKKYNKIFVFNDSFVETQYLINRNLVHKNGEIIYVEDGSNAYMQTIKYENDNKFKFRVKNYLYYGFQYENLGRTFGIHSKIKKRKVLWPSIVRDEFKQDNKVLEEIKKEVLEYGINVCYKNLINKIDREEDKVIILLEHLEFFSINKDISLLRYKEIIDKIVSELITKTIYIKYHPRDSSNYLKDIIDKNFNVKIIENSEPAEIYYISNDISVIAIFSTTLFTAAKILPQMNIISLGKIMNIENKELSDKLVKIGVRMPENYNELIFLLKKQ